MRIAKKLGAIVGILALGSLGALGWSFVKRPLPVPVGIVELPAIPAVADLGLSVLPTGQTSTRHGLSVRGASLTAPLVSAMVTFVISHPTGRILIDAGMGRNGADHVSTAPLLMRSVIDLEMISGTAAALMQHGVQPTDLRGVVLTHAHWDHVSGLEDMPGVPVWVTPEELDYAREDEGALLYRQIDAAQPLVVREINYPDGPYGPFPRSFDFFGDESVILVPMPGHTPGSLAVLVNLPSGRRYLFIGDTAWAREGVQWPAEKPWISRHMVDLNPETVREQLVLLHRLRASNPELVIVPAHDARVHEGIAHFPEQER